MACEFCAHLDRKTIFCVAKKRWNYNYNIFVCIHYLRVGFFFSPTVQKSGILAKFQVYHAYWFGLVLAWPGSSTQVPLFEVKFNPSGETTLKCSGAQESLECSVSFLFYLQFEIFLVHVAFICNEFCRNSCVALPFQSMYVKCVSVLFEMNDLFYVCKEKHFATTGPFLIMSYVGCLHWAVSRCWSVGLLSYFLVRWVICPVCCGWNCFAVGSKFVVHNIVW